MTETTEILFTCSLYHEWVSAEILTVVKKSRLISDEIFPYLNHELEVHQYWLCILREEKFSKINTGKTIQEITASYNQYHDIWKLFITSLKKHDFNRLIKYSNEAGLIKTHSLIDVIIESFRLIEIEQRVIALQLENNYRKKVKIGFLDFRQRINSL